MSENPSDPLDNPVLDAHVEVVHEPTCKCDQCGISKLYASVKGHTLAECRCATCLLITGRLFS